LWRCCIPIISSYAEPEPFSEDQTLLTLYSLAGEESGGFVTFRPQIFIQIGKTLFSQGAVRSPVQDIGAVDVRELTPAELARAERELWTHYHQQTADRINDRLFAAFAGTKLIGVARCSRHPDGLEVDAVYVLDEYRRRGFARSVMILLVEECGRQETLYMHSKTELVDFYGSLGFYPMAESELPKTIRDRFGFVMGNLKGIDVCPMKRDPTVNNSEQNT
jgi:GNAT superfamily N-acetyltransferase